MTSTTRFTITADDDSTYVVRIRQADYVAWDKTSLRHKWGSSADSPFLFSSFLAYNAAKREGHVPDGQSFDAFCDQVLDVHPFRDDTEEDGEARPTRRAASPA